MTGHSDSQQPRRGRPTGSIEATSSGGTVLIVDDEPHLVGMYAAMLEDSHTVQTATSGEAALDRITDDIDVVLLDRRMLGLSGDEVLGVIREQECGCRVAMVTSVEPDADIVELPFDAYLVKPIRQRDLRELVDDLLLRSQYSAGVQKLFSIASKVTALESQLDETELEEHKTYQGLLDQRDRLQTEHEEQIAELLDRGDTGLVYRDVLGAVEEP